MDGLKQRSRTLVELAQSAAFYVRPRPIPLDEKGRKLLDDSARAALASLGRPLVAADGLERGRRWRAVPGAGRARPASASASWRSRCAWR